VGRSGAIVSSELAVAVASHGIAAPHCLLRDPLEDAEFDQLLGACEHHRIIGFLGAAVRDGAFAVTGHQRDRIDSTWQGWLSHAVRVERLLLDATTTLERHGIRSIVLKGVALAHTEYPETSTRVFGDVDLLVEPHHFTRAAEVLETGIGAERSLPELRRGFDNRFGKEILLRARDLEFDLHRMFVEGPYGVAIELSDLWQSPDVFELGGREVLALAPPARVLHAAYAAALGDWPPRLNALRDFAQAVLGDPTRLAAALALARRWHCDAVVRVACERARETFSIDLAPDHTELLGPLSRRDRVFLASYRGGGRGYLRNLAAPIAIRGLGNKVRYVRSVAFPDPTYLGARGATRQSFVREAWAKVRSDRRARS